MKIPLTHSITLAACILGTTLCLPAYANHRTGDFALPEIIVGGDFNRDGKLDLALNVTGFDNIAILTGDGQGNFTLKGHIETDTLPKGIDVGDVNKDGRLDIVSLSTWGYNIKVNLGNGSGGFSVANELNGDGEPTRMLLRDFNNDGHLDILANAPAEGALLVYLGKGGGSFSNSAIELEDIANDYSIAAGDFNHDGNEDIAATSFTNKGETGSHVIVFLGDGTGQFTRVAEVLTSPQPSDLEVADMNGDGKLDLIASGAGAENETGLFVDTLLGDGTGQFTLSQATNLGDGSLGGRVALGDFNGDGHTDVAFPITTSQALERSTTVLIFLGDGTGKLTAGTPLVTGVAPHSVFSADFNRDGHLDLAVSNRTDATVSIFLGAGDGTFVDHATIPIAVLPSP